MFNLFRQSVDARTANVIEKLIHEAPDHDLCGVNVIALASDVDLDEEEAITAFLHAARIGLFELSWNILCPGCGGVLNANASLKDIRRDSYECELCAAGYNLTLDEMVEVTFTVSERIRRIAAHHPETLPIWEYYRQILWGSGLVVPADFQRAMEEAVLDSVELPPAGTAMLSLPLPTAYVVVFEPVTHAAYFLDVKGEPTRERQSISIVYSDVRAPTGAVQLKPGPLRLALENRTSKRLLPAVWITGTAMHHLLSKRRPFLTAKRLLSNQTFRDIYRTDTLDLDQRLKITSLTFLFTDLRGSTALYHRVGDLAAYELVRRHFDALTKVTAAWGGAIVKTIGDAVMATFPTPDRAVAAALAMREIMGKLNEECGREDLLLKIGIHEGPCLAVMLNERPDYFGHTVNVAARVQALAGSRAIFATQSVMENPQTSKLLKANDIKLTERHFLLEGLADELAVFEIR
jgi:class 3 adenylate cyclase